MRPDCSFRLVTEGDLPALATLNVLAYPWGDVTVEKRLKRYRERRAIWSADALIVERGGRHVGQYTTLHFTGWIGGEAVAVGGLAGVAVAPEARRSGIAGAIVEHHLRRCREHGKGWSMLYPFANSFYARFGYAPTARRMRWRFRPRALPLLNERSLVERLSLGDPIDLASLQVAYDSFCIRTNGSLSRTLAQLALNYPDPRTLVVGVRGDGGGLAGYLIATLRAETPRPQTLTITERVAADDRAHRALIGFLAAQDDQADFIELDAHPDDPVGALLTLDLPVREDDRMPDEHHPMGTLFGGLMARLVDLPRALLGRGYPKRTDLAIAFDLQDPILVENCAPVTLALADGQPRITAGIVPGAAVLRGPVGEVSRVLVGAMGLAAAVRYGLVTVAGGDLALLDAALALPSPYPIPIF